MANLKKRKKAGRLLSTHFNFPNFLLLISIFTLIGAVIIFRSSAITYESFDPDAEELEINSGNRTVVVNGTNRTINSINYHRTNAHGKNALTRSRCLTDIARRWSRKMAEAGKISHQTGTQLKGLITKYCGSDWTLYAENVGVGPNEPSIFYAFMNSDGHHSNIHLSGIDTVGVGVYNTKNSSGQTTVYITQIFANCTDCNGDWKAAPATSCRPKLSYAGLLYDYSDGFEMGDIDLKKWNEITTTNKWYTWTDSGSRPRRAGSSVTRHDCWLMFVENPSSGSASVAQIVPASGSTSYKLTGYSRLMDGSTSQFLYLDFLDSNKNRVKEYHKPTSLSSGWQPVILGPYKSPSSTRYIRVMIYGSSGYSQYYWDDIDLRKN